MTDRHFNNNLQKHIAMTILLQRLFLVVFLFGTVFTVALGQGGNQDGSSNDSGGIFKNKKKVEGDGGQGQPDDFCLGDVQYFDLQILTRSADLPCNMHVGLTQEGRETYFAPIELSLIHI